MLQAAVRYTKTGDKRHLLTLPLEQRQLLEDVLPPAVRRGPLAVPERFQITDQRDIEPVADFGTHIADDDYILERQETGSGERRPQEADSGARPASGSRSPPS